MEFRNSIANRLESNEKVNVFYPDQTKMVIRKLLEVGISQMLFEGQYKNHFHGSSSLRVHEINQVHF